MNKTSTPVFSEEVITLEDLWLQHERQHKSLLEMATVHVTGTKRFPKPKPELSNTFEEHNNLVIVVSSRGLVFVGQPKSIKFLHREGFKKIGVGQIASVCKYHLSFSEIGKRTRDPLCLLPLVEETPVITKNSKDSNKKKGKKNQKKVRRVA